MTPKVKQIRDAMVAAVVAISDAEHTKALLYSIGDEAAKKMIAEAEVNAAKKIADVADAIIMNTANN